MQPPPSAQRAELVLLSSIIGRPLDIQIPEELNYAFGVGSGAALTGRYFFRDVFFATFLVAFAVFFAFFALLAIWSSM